MLDVFLFIIYFFCWKSDLEAVKIFKKNSLPCESTEKKKQNKHRLSLNVDLKYKKGGKWNKSLKNKLKVKVLFLSCLFLNSETRWVKKKRKVKIKKAKGWISNVKIKWKFCNIQVKSYNNRHCDYKVNTQEDHE